jgi:hypothetical protein
MNNDSQLTWLIGKTVSAADHDECYLHLKGVDFQLDIALTAITQIAGDTNLATLVGKSFDEAVAKEKEALFRFSDGQSIRVRLVFRNSDTTFGDEILMELTKLGSSPIIYDW